MSKERNLEISTDCSDINEIKKYYEKSENNIFKFKFNLNLEKHYGTAFILEIDKKYKLPFKRALITNNHNFNDEVIKYNSSSIILENQKTKEFLF